MKQILIIMALGLLLACVQKTYKRTINFSVDMRQAGEVQSVGVRGDFRPLNWNEDYPLSDPDGDSIYTGQLILDTPFDFVSVKFVKNGADFELEGKENRRIDFEDKKSVVVKAVFDQHLDQSPPQN